MKKVAVFILLMLIIILSAFAFYLHSYSKEPVEESKIDLALQKRILNNSSWTYLTEEDFFGYINGTYTEPVNKIITSLEEATPVIIQTSNEKFGDLKSGTFIVASAFNASNRVYTYCYNPQKNIYQKSLNSLETLLDGANAAFIYSGTEGL